MFRKFTLLIVFLIFCVVVTSAFVRLSDAGLACPDWPGCFGSLEISDASAIRNHNTANQDTAILSKTTISMSQRYLAGLTVVMIFVLWLASFFVRANRKSAIILSTGLLVSVMLQTAIGMAVIHFKLMPFWVSGHLLSGLFTLSIAFWLYMRVDPALRFVEKPRTMAVWAKFSALVVVFEIMLGSWTSANYAALACPDFPTCLDSWWPHADYLQIFNVFPGMELNYRGGVLSHDARIAINWLHRIGAFFAFLVLGGLALSVSSSKWQRKLRKAGVLLSALLLTQIALGIATVIFRMPIWVGVAHNGVAALLLLNVIYINFWIAKDLAAPADEVLGKTSNEAVTSAVDISVAPGTPLVIPEPEVQVEPAGLFQRLSTQLQRTRSGLTDILTAIPLGKKEIDSELLEDIESTLILADIGVDATREIIDNLTRSVQRKELSDASALGTELRKQLLAMLEPCDLPLTIEPNAKPFVILVVGVNGVGKTTTIGKLAKRLQSKGLSVMLAAGDTFRAAAVEQLQTWGERNGVPVVAQQTGADSASVVFDALKSAQARGIDVLIADTAGRLHTKDNLMEELRKVKRIMAKLDPDAPHEVLLVVDAGTGQNTLSQAEQFNQVIGLTGIALTKLDGTAKGGVIFALAKRLGIPIRFIGIGEGINDLQDFNAQDFIDALFAQKTEV